ncbi:MAG: phytanoyl-CoA dioxygenase family protein [Exilibacterium sp.]
MDDSYQEYGFVWADDIDLSAEISAIKDELRHLSFRFQGGGVRNAEKKFTTVRALIGSRQLQQVAQRYVDDKIDVVRAILFNKSQDNNWLVTWHQDKTIAVAKRWHQDKTIAVAKRHDVAGWGPWSIKDGCHHVQPPEHLLNRRVTFRIHIDDADKDNGCLKVIPRSHRYGALSPEAIQQCVANASPVYCTAISGSTLVMHPMILHASSKAKVALQRRVLHIEWRCFDLPHELA